MGAIKTKIISLGQRWWPKLKAKVGQWRQVKLRFWLRWIFLGTIAVFILGIVSLWWGLHRFNLAVFVPPATVQPREHTEHHPWPTFSATARVRQDELQAYYLMAVGRDWPSWRQQQVEQGILVAVNNAGEEHPHGSFWAIKQDFKLPPPWPNQCRERNCYQHRVAFDEISPILWKALMAIEDDRFLEHRGVDWKSIIRAAVMDLKAWELKQGASTLTQQLVKNIFFTQEKNFWRKFKEVIYAIYFETQLPKDAIITAYLNEVFWGVAEQIQLKGIYAASVFYFQKAPAELSAFEAAILVAMLKGPGFYDPLRHLDRLQERTKLVFRQLQDLNYLDLQRDRPWDKTTWQKWQKRLIQQSEHPLKVAALAEEEDSDLNPYEQFVWRHKASSILQQMQQRLPDEDFAIKAMIGAIKDSRPFQYYSKWQRAKAAALNDERHQIGSIFKPLIYQIFLRHGRSLEEMVATGEIELNLPSGPWRPQEAHQVEEEEVSLAEALRLSLNRPLIRVAQEVGFGQIEQGINHLEEFKLPLASYPAQLLGAVEFSVGRIFEIYRNFILDECRWLNVAGEEASLLPVLADPSATTVRKVLDPHLAGAHFFGKTGTSNHGRDNWFVFFDGQLLGVIWAGIEIRHQDRQLNLYGSTTAFQIYQQFILDRGKPVQELNCHFLTSSAALAKDNDE
ncbi:MAG: penicillin-binding protein [Bacteriovoracaceae bacterium]|nr:penicillin-binding protein [Bacteriovoracaceae bacterium]